MALRYILSSSISDSSYSLIKCSLEEFSMNNKRSFKDRAVMRKRMVLALWCITSVFALLIIRLSYIMLVKRYDYSSRAEEQWTSEVRIDSRRGRILDRNGNELAVSANVYRIDFDLNSIRQYLKKNQKKNFLRQSIRFACCSPGFRTCIYYFRAERPVVICAMFCGCCRLWLRAKRRKSNSMNSGFNIRKSYWILLKQGVLKINRLRTTKT